MDLPTIRDIDAARRRIAGRVHRTPILTSATLAGRLGVPIFLKAENLQKTGSFKARGALNAVSQLSAADAARGVISVSAGNHAAALSWAARDAGVQATVVMPANANPVKVAAVRRYGGRPVLHGASAVETFAEMERLRAERGFTLVHPFDNSHVIAGAGTLGSELLDDLPDADTVVIGIGGGGLIAGAAMAIKERRPKSRVIGVEPVGADSMARSREAGRPIRLDRVETVADGLASPYAGEYTFPLVQRYVDDVVRVTDEEILTGLRFLLERCKLVAEPAGAAAAAAVLLGRVTPRPGGNIVIVVSGGNLDLSRASAFHAAAPDALA